MKLEEALTQLEALGTERMRAQNTRHGAGEKLGIYRDYPVSKGCTSPFAPVWIEEMVRRQG